MSKYDDDLRPFMIFAEQTMNKEKETPRPKEAAKGWTSQKGKIAEGMLQVYASIAAKRAIRGKLPVDLPPAPEVKDVETLKELEEMLEATRGLEEDLRRRITAIRRATHDTDKDKDKKND